MESTQYAHPRFTLIKDKFFGATTVDAALESACTKCKTATKHGDVNDNERQT
jgi:hypothetical protein